MNKKVFRAFICFAVVLSFVQMSSSAHSGRTDANGGHHVGGTSEYHYHHGYPAHSHINGVCEYAFDDKTGHSSGSSHSGGSSSSSGSNSGGKLIVIPTDEPKISKEPVKVESEEDKIEGSPFALVSTIVLLSLFAYMLFSLCREHKLAKRKKQEMTLKYSGKSISAIAGVPACYTVDFDDKVYLNGAPITSTEIYNVYILQGGSCYHDKRCKCMSRNYKKVTIHQALKSNYRPCRVCYPKGECPVWYKDYKEINSIRRKYNIQMVP